MKKKILGIFVCTLMVTTAIPTVSSISKIIEKNDNNEYIPTEIIFDDDCGCGKTNTIGHRFEKIKERSKPLTPDETIVKPTVMSDLPEYFNWMDFEGQDWTTPAKNQGNCGSCGIFSAIGALESIINIREGRADLDIDLAEQYVLSCLPRYGNCTLGTWSYKIYYYILSNKSSGNNCNGIIPESCFPYRGIDYNGCTYHDCDSEPVLCDEKCEDWDNYLVPISDFGLWFPNGSTEDRDAIKTQIMQHGPVASYMMVTYYIHGEDNFYEWGYEHHDPEDYFPYPGPIKFMNHVVVIVGWKDDPSIGNGGYWICKNSWGPDWGYNGFFNIEYGSLQIDEFQIDWVEYDPDVYVNWRPVPDAGGIYYGDVGQEILFDASSSFDHEGEIIAYEWDFGDGYHQYGITATHSYDSEDVYPVTLTVRDNEGNIVNDTTWAFIGRLNTPPNTITIDGPAQGKKGVTYDYNFSAIDPENDEIYYYIEWGDGEDIKLWIGPYASGEEITINHTYIDESSFTIRVLTKDMYDFKSDWATLEVTMPKNNPFNFNFKLLNWLIERFPHAFPILRHLLGLTGGLEL